MGINRPISNLIQHTFVLCDEREKDVLSLRPDAMIRPSHVHCLKLARFHGCSLTERRSMRRNMKTSPWVRWPAGWDNCAKPAMRICVRRKILKVWDELQKSFCNLCQFMQRNTVSHSKESSGFGHPSSLTHAQVRGLPRVQSLGLCSFRSIPSEGFLPFHHRSLSSNTSWRQSEDSSTVLWKLKLAVSAPDLKKKNRCAACVTLEKKANTSSMIFYDKSVARLHHISTTYWSIWVTFSLFGTIKMEWNGTTIDLSPWTILDYILQLIHLDTRLI